MGELDIIGIVFDAVKTVKLVFLPLVNGFVIQPVQVIHKHGLG